MNQAKIVFISLLMWQTILFCLTGVIAYIVGGKLTAVSAMLGGFSVLFASIFGCLIYLRNKDNKNPIAILTSMVLAEIVRLAFVLIFLLMVFKYYKNLVPEALIVGLIVMAVLSGAVISSQQKKIH